MVEHRDSRDIIGQTKRKTILNHGKSVSVSISDMGAPFDPNSPPPNPEYLLEMVKSASPAKMPRKQLASKKSRGRI